MFKHISKIVVVLAVAFVPVFSQEDPAPTKDELSAQFATLLKANKMEIKIDLSLDDVKTNMSSIIENAKSLTDPQKQELKIFAQDAFSRLVRQTEKVLAESEVLSKLGEKVVVDVYDKAFTESELKDLIAFFKTPLGQKAVDFLAPSKNRIAVALRSRCN